MTSYLIEFSETVAVALEVIAGKYGDNPERKEKLTKAGYDYSTVQSCVNELVKVMNKYA